MGNEKTESEIEKYNLAAIPLKKIDEVSSFGSVQSPTISSVSDSAPISSSSTMRKRKSSDRIMEELELAQKRITELEDIIRLKDERIKLLEEEHERHLLHQTILASPEIER